MLVLSRKQGEQIIVGDCVKITVLQVQSGKVRLGVNAPAEVAIHRQELYERLGSTALSSAAPSLRNV